MTILTWLMASSLLWGAVIWGAGCILQRSSDVSGRARQWIWRGATVLLVAPWIAAPVVAAFGWGLAPAEADIVAASTMVTSLPVDEFTGEALLDFSGAPVMHDIDLTQALLILLAAGWIVRFVAAQLAARSLLGIVAQARAAENGPATVALDAWTRRLGLRRAPRLLTVAASISPFSFGVFRPVVCLPEGLENRLGREALDLVVGHECLHVARGDGWLRPLERVAADIFWFNPFAWFIRRELDVARELACDEGVVELSSARQAYARTLRDVAGFSAGLSHAAPAASMSLAGGRSLMLRVTRTLALARRKPARAALIAACLLGAIGAPIAVAQVVLATPRAPVAPPAPPAPPAPELEALAPLPPAAPEVPEAPEAIEALEAPEAPEVDALEAVAPLAPLAQPPAPPAVAPAVPAAPSVSPVAPAPPAPPAPPQRVSLRAPFGGSVVSISRDEGGLYDLELAQAAMSSLQHCNLLISGVQSVKVMPRDTIKAGEIIGVIDQALMPKVLTCRETRFDRSVPVKQVTPAPQAVADLRIANAPHAIIDQAARTTSSFGNRVDPFSDKTVFHPGIDLAAPRNVEVHAPGSAVVMRAERAGDSGNVVEIRTPENFVLRFGHLDEIKVKAGDQVGADAVVGTMGSSGQSTGPHLHLEVLVNGEPVDPAQVQGLKLTAG